MYEVKLINNRDKDHESDWFQRPSKSEAKTLARQNFIDKYPNDDLEDTEYIVKTV